MFVSVSNAQNRLIGKLKKLCDKILPSQMVVLLVVLLFYVHGKHLRSCRDGQLT